MTALIIVAIILLLLLVILFASVKLKISYNNGGYLKVEYLFLKFNVPLKDWQKSEITTTKKEKSKKNKDNITENKGFLKQLIKDKGFIGAVTEVFNTVSSLLTEIFNLLKKITIEKFYINVTIGQKDAAETAISYGVINSAACILLATVNGIFYVKDQKININSDFDNEILDISLSLEAFVRVYKVIIALLKAGIKFIKLKSYN